MLVLVSKSGDTTSRGPKLGMGTKKERELKAPQQNVRRNGLKGEQGANVGKHYFWVIAWHGSVPLGAFYSLP